MFLASLTLAMLSVSVNQQATSPNVGDITQKKTQEGLARLMIRCTVVDGPRDHPRKASEADIALYQKLTAAKRKINKRLDILLVNQDYDAAFDAVKGYFDVEPTDVRPYVLMGDIRMRQGKVDEAVNFYTQASQKIEAMTNYRALDTTPYVRLGDLCVSRGDYAGAVSAYRHAVYRAEKYDWTLPDGTSIKRSLFPPAVWSTAAAKRPVEEDVTVLCRLALALTHEGQHTEAMHLYQEAVKAYVPEEGSTATMGSAISPLNWPGANCIGIRWGDVFALPVSAEATDLRTFKAACYGLISLSIGQIGWIDENGKNPYLRREHEQSVQAIVRKAADLAPEYGPAQLVEGLAYERSAEKDAPAKALIALRKATICGNEATRAAASEALQRIATRQDAPGVAVQ